MSSPWDAVDLIAQRGAKDSALNAALNEVPQTLSEAAKFAASKLHKHAVESGSQYADYGANVDDSSHWNLWKRSASYLSDSSYLGGASDASSQLLKRTNAALEKNPNIFAYPRTADINIDTHGSNWYWAVCALMSFSFLVIIGLSYLKPRHDRIFHWITAAILLTASISYFSMASNLGYAAIGVEYLRTGKRVMGVTRAVFYVRYIDWFVTTPLLLLDILLTAHVPWPTILATIFLDWVMIITGLVGALTASSYKWGYFTFAMIALCGIAWNVLFVARSYSKRMGPAIHGVFLLAGGWTMFLWFLYPIAWGLSEGGNVIGSDGEAIFYGVLDILAKVGFAILLLGGHRNIDPAVLGCKLRDYDDYDSFPDGENGRAGYKPAMRRGPANYGLSARPNDRGGNVQSGVTGSEPVGQGGEARARVPPSNAGAINVGTDPAHPPAVSRAAEYNV